MNVLIVDDQIRILGAIEDLVGRRKLGVAWGRWLVRKEPALVRNQIINLLHYAEKQQYLTVVYMQKVIHSFWEAAVPNRITEIENVHQTVQIMLKEIEQYKTACRYKVNRLAVL